MHASFASRRCLASAAAALLLALALPACKGLSPDTYNPHAPAHIHRAGPVRPADRRQPRVYFADDPETRRQRPPTSRFRPQDVPRRWRHSDLAPHMRRAPILP